MAAYFYGAADLDRVPDAPSAEAPGGQYIEQAILTNDSSYANSDLALNFPIPMGVNYQDFPIRPSTQSSCTPSSSSGRGALPAFVPRHMGLKVWFGPGLKWGTCPCDVRGGVGGLSR
jgi:hypothetical protein